MASSPSHISRIHRTSSEDLVFPALSQTQRVPQSEATCSRLLRLQPPRQMTSGMASQASHQANGKSLDALRDDPFSAARTECLQGSRRPRAKNHHLVV